MHFLLRRCLLMLGLVFVLARPQAARAQHFDQLTRPIASITSRTLIDTILDELLILAPDSARVTRIDVVDLTANGYGPDDVLILYPALETYLLRGDVPAHVQAIMKQWELEADYRLDASLAESRRVEDEAHRRRSAADALSGAVIAVLGRYYHAPDIDLRLSRDQTGLRLEMWNFDPAAMQYVPPPDGPECVPSEPPVPTLAFKQQFRFRQPRFILAFRDPGACVVTVLSGGKMQTRPCTP
ncbi:MAG: hypothetical protein ACE5G0_09305 [Rhodothermales bacterium]